MIALRRVRARGKQRHNDILAVSAAERQKQGRSSVAVDGVHVGSGVDQFVQHADVKVLCRRVADGVPAAPVLLLALGARGEQDTDDLGFVGVVGRVHQRRTARRVCSVGLRSGGKQISDLFRGGRVAARGGGRHQRRHAADMGDCGKFFVAQRLRHVRGASRAAQIDKFLLRHRQPPAGRGQTKREGKEASRAYFQVNHKQHLDIQNLKRRYSRALL